MVKNRIVFICVFYLIKMVTYAQSSTYIDDKGVMRWAKSKQEVCVFGTNYSVPFSYWNYREPLIKGRYKEAIDQDVYHIARLGIDGFRIHVMESFIADENGNLKNNIHLDLFDYLLFKLKEKNIKMYITPMYLGESQGGSFTDKYNFNAGCLSNQAAYPAQENYLKQFLSHVNPYTKIAYKDDSDIIAFEVVNEPKHFKKPELVIPYINKMISAIKSTGCDKPLLYNMTTCAGQIDEVLASNAEGGSFQWYPTGLTANHEQKGNLLPNVDQYLIPFHQKLKDSKRPKFVYEFSPADTKGAYMYPAMARSFREAGFQFAAHFAYDPLHEAHTNIEYKTHFFNIAYTPKKAIGMMIASEVFHELPLEKSYGRFPLNNKFECFSLSYENDLAEMVTNKKFLYSNNTNSKPKNPKELELIAGVGSSPLIHYNGNGAYFLDKLDEGVWRLELMPDAHYVTDPFFVPYINREVAVTISREHTMQIKLPDLGNNFKLKGLNKENYIEVIADKALVKVKPGVYLLSQKNKKYVANEKLKEFYIPTNKMLQKSYLLHQPPLTISKGEKLKLEADIISNSKIEQVELVILNNGKPDVLPMLQKNNGFTYELLIPEKYIKLSQFIRYHISYKINGEYYSYPGGKKDAYLLNRRIYGDDESIDKQKPYSISVMELNSPIILFNATNDWDKITKMGRSDKVQVYPSAFPNQYKIRLKSPKRNKYGDEFAFKFYCADKIKGRRNELKLKKEVILKAQAFNDDLKPIKIQLLLKNGSVYSGEIKIGKELKSYSVLLKDLKLDNVVLLPRAYPKFQAYNFKSVLKTTFNIEELEAIQVLTSEKEKSVDIYTVGLQ